MRDRLAAGAWPRRHLARWPRGRLVGTTGRNFSMGVPLTNDLLGMPHGFRLGTNITTGRFSPVLQNLVGLAENDVSGSVGMVGELGSGAETDERHGVGEGRDR